MSQAIDGHITRSAPRQLALFSLPPIPDLKLFGLALRLDEAWALEREVLEALPGELYDDAMLVTAAIVDEIAETPATTIPGLLIKARALSWCFDGHPVGQDGDGVASQLSNAILRQLVRMDEARAG